MINENFTVIINEDRKQFEFISNSNRYTSYTVGFDVCDNLSDAKIIVWQAIQNLQTRKTQNKTT